MSRATELEAMGNALAAHSMMKPVDLAQFLGLSAPTVKLLLDAGTIPSVGEGKCRRIDPIRGAPAPLIAQYATLALAGLQIDPIDAAVYALASKAGQTITEYRSEHGRTVGERAGRYYREIMDFRRAAA